MHGAVKRGVSAEIVNFTVSAGSPLFFVQIENDRRTMTEIEKLTQEVIWDGTRSYGDFNPSFVNDKSPQTKLRMGLIRALVTIDMRCGSIQDKTFLKMKEDLKRALLEYPDWKTLKELLTTWIEYIEVTKTSIRAKNLKYIRQYLLDLQVELGQQEDEVL